MKAILAVAIILAITIPTIFIVVNNILSPPESEPFNLDNAPQYVKDLKTDLKDKIETSNFTMEEDMPKFVTFAQYLADNSPEIQELLQNWEATVVFDFDSDIYMWFLISDGSVTIESGETPPAETILILLDVDVFMDIMRQDETPLSAYQKGVLNFSGPFNEVLTIAQVTGIAAATLMDLPPTVSTGGPDIEITIDNSEDYIEGGLTLIPLIDITVVPEHIGEHHKSLVGVGQIIVVDKYGDIVAELEQSSHTVHKFINSSTVAMGGQEGDMQLWNYQTGYVQTLSVPAGHHELEYNPFTETFMVLEYVFGSEVYNGSNVIYDMLSEYNMNGDLVWQWDPRIYFPFNGTRFATLGVNETFRGGIDWMHSNSFAWDKENDTIFLNIRSLDTILKIDYNTKQVLWDAGRNGDFTLLNASGMEVDSLFHHSHSLEYIGDDHFIMYDNDLYNPAKPLTMNLENSSGDSRLLELEIDEDTMTMREVWSYTPTDPDYYFPESGGDADRLPGGNTIGGFGGKALILNVRDPVFITEVTQDGTVAWEMQINGINESYYWVHRIERFYEEPVIAVNSKAIDTTEGTMTLNLTTYNCVKQDWNTNGTLTVLADGLQVYKEEFEFLPQWQPNNFFIDLDTINPGTARIQIVVENSDGVTATLLVYGTPPASLPIVLILVIIGAIVIVIPTVFYLRKTGRLGG